MNRRIMAARFAARGVPPRFSGAGRTEDLVEADRPIGHRDGRQAARRPTRTIREAIVSRIRDDFDAPARDVDGPLLDDAAARDRRRAAAFESGRITTGFCGHTMTPRSSNRRKNSRRYEPSARHIADRRRLDDVSLRILRCSRRGVELSTRSSLSFPRRAILGFAQASQGALADIADYPGA